MLRIQLLDQQDGTATLQLAGRVAGPWVHELSRSCDRILGVGGALNVDLREVTFVDRAGVELLRSLCDRHVGLAHCSPFVAEQLKPAMGRSIDESTPDHDLLAALAAGEARALEVLAERYGGRIYRLAFGVTRNQGDAEEVLQDVLLTLARKGASFEGRSALPSWIYRITTNAALNKRRGKRREVESSLEDLLPAFKEDGHRDGERSCLLADWSQSPEEECLAGERRRVLERALEALPEHYRAVLVLRDVEGLSNEEVAEILSESVPSVKSRLHRARMILREQLTRAFV